MGERQNLQRDLEHYRTLRAWTTDKRALAAIESLIRESEDRLAVLAVVADTQSDIGEAQKGRILSP
jgi:hypothetical protein